MCELNRNQVNNITSLTKWPTSPDTFSPAASASTPIQTLPASSTFPPFSATSPLSKELLYDKVLRSTYNQLSAPEHQSPSLARFLALACEKLNGLAYHEQACAGCAGLRQRPPAPGCQTHWLEPCPSVLRGSAFAARDQRTASLTCGDNWPAIDPLSRTSYTARTPPTTMGLHEARYAPKSAIGLCCIPPPWTQWGGGGQTRKHGCVYIDVNYKT
ncbi:hypothetical protein BGZ63DRAFT_401177 [Mariannaea sp. PMI_226]|nr:hypothetical protein BGZ63DRAFT_401177 [Mariannaea sp. PMI_226]